MINFFEENPMGFDAVLGEINVEVEKECTPQIFRDIYLEGEKIDNELAEFLKCGIDEGIVKKDIIIFKIILFFWSTISGIIRTVHTMRNVMWILYMPKLMLK